MTDVRAWYALPSVSSFSKETSCLSRSFFFSRPHFTRSRRAQAPTSSSTLSSRSPSLFPRAALLSPTYLHTPPASTPSSQKCLKPDSRKRPRSSDCSMVSRPPLSAFSFASRAADRVSRTTAAIKELVSDANFECNDEGIVSPSRDLCERWEEGKEGREGRDDEGRGKKEGRASSSGWGRQEHRELSARALHLPPCLAPLALLSPARWQAGNRKADNLLLPFSTSLVCSNFKRWITLTSLW
jgi:hypothetical protein